MLALELYRKVDDVSWTYVTPPVNFTNGPRTGDYRIGGDRALENSRGRTRVSRADFAVAVIDEAERRCIPGSGYSSRTERAERRQRQNRAEPARRLSNPHPVSGRLPST
ncbi:MAG: hypothetical protein OEQ25_12450 [Gammaproteobacteria bacterium]|nr:hypothetical protein [Gammaproteobacteria bacterium]